MNNSHRVYIAGVGMITAIGANTEMTSASVRAGISGYKISDFYTQDESPITMASVPDEVFSCLDVNLQEGDRHNECHDRIVKMAIVALQEACTGRIGEKIVPLVLATADILDDNEGLEPLIDAIEANCPSWISKSRFRRLVGNRSIGIEAIDFALRSFEQINDDYILVGSSDSFQEQSRLTFLDEKSRLLSHGSKDGFAPGEAACFLLLTRKRELALARNGCLVALNPPGLAEEPGHLYSDQPYLGEGLDQAFKRALSGDRSGGLIDRIYSSMNGEHHWAKEYGVASIRNAGMFSESVEIEHPADLLGDTCAASGLLLIALAAENLYKNPQARAHLVYSSSDNAPRGAIVLEKIAGG